VTPRTEKVLARDVRVGDRLLLTDGSQLTVTRIDQGVLDLHDLIAFIEDSDVRWMKLPRAPDAEVDVIREDG
jgi:hypothetical protein